jgi:hypothetical protein
MLCYVMLCYDRPHASLVIEPSCGQADGGKQRAYDALPEQVTLTLTLTPPPPSP